jgi:hypothetical protein
MYVTFWLMFSVATILNLVVVGGWSVFVAYVCSATAWRKWLSAGAQRKPVFALIAFQSLSRSLT